MCLLQRTPVCPGILVIWDTGKLPLGLISGRSVYALRQEVHHPVGITKKLPAHPVLPWYLFQRYSVVSSTHLQLTNLPFPLHQAKLPHTGTGFHCTAAQQLVVFPLSWRSWSSLNNGLWGGQNWALSSHMEMGTDSWRIQLTCARSKLELGLQPKSCISCHKIFHRVSFLSNQVLIQVHC